jgi:hypothetical protein
VEGWAPMAAFCVGCRASTVLLSTMAWAQSATPARRTNDAGIQELRGPRSAMGWTP